MKKKHIKPLCILIVVIIIAMCGESLVDYLLKCVW